MQNSVVDMKSYFATTPPELQNAMMCPWFDDCDITQTTKQKQQEYQRLRQGRDLAIADAEAFLKEHGERNLWRCGAWLLLQQVAEAYNVVIDMRARYERAFKTHCGGTERKTWFHVAISDRDITKNSIGHISLDLDDLEQTGEQHIQLFVHANAFIGFADIGMIEHVIPHESVHIWDCVERYAKNGADAVLQDSKVHREQGRAYDEEIKKYNAAWDNTTDPALKDPILAVETYHSLTLKKKLYSDLIDYERKVTRFYELDSGLTEYQAVEIAHSPFFDNMMYMLWQEDLAEEYEDVIEDLKETLTQVSAPLRPIYGRWLSLLQSSPQQIIKLQQMKQQIANSKNQSLDLLPIEEMQSY